MNSVLDLNLLLRLLLLLIALSIYAGWTIINIIGKRRKKKNEWKNAFGKTQL